MLTFFIFYRIWEHEVQISAKELRKPKLTKVIIKGYWKTYTVLGLFTLFEVCRKYAVCLKKKYIYIYMRIMIIPHDHSFFFCPNQQETVKVIQPLFLGKLIQYFEHYDPDDMNGLYEAIGYAAGISLSTICLTVVHHLYYYHVQREGMKIRVAMCHMIYKKVRIRFGFCAGCVTTRAA